MHVALCSFPSGDLTQPYTSLPALSAHLRRLGVEVSQRDYGIDFAHHWMDAMRFPRLLAALRDVIETQEDRGVVRDGWEDYVDLKLLEARLSPYADSLASRLRLLKAPDVTDDLPRLSDLLDVLAAFQSILSLVERQPFLPQPSFQALGIEAALHVIDAPSFLHAEFLAEVVLPSVVALRPDLVGISVTYPKQLMPSLVACRAFKRALPNVPIVIGGAYLSTIAETLVERSELTGLWDYAVDGEGETALAQLVEHLAEQNPDVSDVANVLWHTDGAVHRSSRRHDEVIHTLATPDFRGLNLDSYLAPTPIFLLPVARGCYMRCTFCSISYATRSYRSRTGEEIVRDIETVREHFGVESARHFNFSIDVMAPKHLKEMAIALINADLGITWDAEIRFDNGLRSDTIDLMRQAGCRHIRFGLESAVDRIRDLMDKRIEIRRVREILDDCRRNDIKASTMIIIGFPGERESEARETFQFLWDNSDKIRFFALNVYTVSRGSIIENSPEDFGIVLTTRPDRLVQPSWDFVVTDGLSTNRARELATEFRWQLKERYPLADEGFSVGIGGSFTFLVSQRWTLEDLRKQDAEVLAIRSGEVRESSVPRVSNKTVGFESPFLFDGDAIRGTGRGLYFVTPRRRVVRLTGRAAESMHRVDGQRSIADIGVALRASGIDIEVERLRVLFEQMQDRGVISCA